MTLTPGEIIGLVVNAVLIGAAWGHLRAGQNRNGSDISSIKRALGLENGQPGAFVRRDQYEYSRDSQEADIVRLEKELAELRNRIA